MEKTGLKYMGVVQGNSYKSLLIITSYSVILFWVPISVHYLWSINQNILVEYLLRIHFSLEIKSYISRFGSQSLQRGCLNWIIFIKRFNGNKNFILFVNLRIILHVKKSLKSLSLLSSLLYCFLTLEFICICCAQSKIISLYI